MKIRYILSLLTVAFLLGSCATPKVAYFTDLKRGTAEQVLKTRFPYRSTAKTPY